MHYRTKRQHVSALQLEFPMTDQFKRLFGDRIMDQGHGWIALRNNGNQSIMVRMNDWVLIAPEGIEVVTNHDFKKYYEDDDGGSVGRHPSHKTRVSMDSSSYDEVCVNCGATDITGHGWGRLAFPCPHPLSEVQIFAQSEYDKTPSNGKTELGYRRAMLGVVLFCEQRLEKTDVGETADT